MAALGCLGPASLGVERQQQFRVESSDSWVWGGNSTIPAPRPSYGSKVLNPVIPPLPPIFFLLP